METMNKTELTALSAAAIARKICDGLISCVEVTDAFLDRISDLNPVLNAVCTLNEDARDQAAQADQRLARGEPARPLEGVPFLVKDILQTTVSYTHLTLPTIYSV